MGYELGTAPVVQRGTPRMVGALEYVRSRVDPDGQSAERKAFEQQWLADLGLYCGVKFVADGGIIRPVRDPAQRSREYQVNMIRFRVLRFAAKLASLHPKTIVLPRTDEWADMQASKLATQAHAHAVDVSGFAKIDKRATLWALIAGSCFTKIAWDPDKGDPDRIYHEGGRVNIDAEYDPTLRSQFDRRGLFTDVYPGEIVAHLVEPWQAWPDPNARDGGIPDCEWFNIRSARSTQSVYDECGVRVAADADAQRGAELYREIAAFMASGLTGTNPPVHKARISESCMQDEMFVRPCKTYPKGAYFRIAGGHVLDEKENPYTAVGCPIPIVKRDCFPVPGRFWGGSLVEDLRGPHRAYVASRGHTMNHQASAGHAPLFIEKGSGISAKQYKGFPGVAYEINKGDRMPQWGHVPNLSPSVAENASVALSEMDKISAQSDPASSKLPGQLRSGIAVQAVQADSNLILTATADSMFEAHEAAGTMMLQLVGMFYDTPRLVNVFGPGNEIDPIELRGADLRRHYRLKVLSQPGDLESSESRDAKLYEAAQLGILNPQNPEHSNILLKGLRFHTGDDYVNRLLRQEADEERAIAEIVNSGGQSQPPVMMFHEPMVRAALLEDRMCTRAFKLYPPPVQEALYVRWQQFSMMLQQRAAAQMEQAAAMNGTPNPRGEASQPAR